jgi:predicted acyl esterase
MRAGTRLGAAAAVLLSLLAGCMAPVQTYYGFDADAQYRNPGVFAGNYSIDSSVVLHGGNLTPDNPVKVRLTSDLPAYPPVAGNDLSDGEVDIVLAYWLPKNQTRVGRIPVIVDAGPYFEIGTHECPYGDTSCTPGTLVNDTIDWPQQMTPWLLQNYLPKGYAVAQVAVRGTGTAGGCMDLLGPSEQHDLDQAITWLGSQDWSNGNVGMIGVSYDGSTPWEVAAKGNPHLKTIVPISGLPDIYDLMFHNGSAETRGPIMHNMVYWGYGFNDEFPYNHLPAEVPAWPSELPIRPGAWPPYPPYPRGEANGRKPYQDLQNLLCPEVVEGSAVAGLSSTVGGRWEESTYWTERDHRPGVLANYEGSVFLVHGLQDWNVDPHAAIPFNVELRKAGIEVKEWYGQWDHARPDSSCAQRAPDYVTMPCRIDWAEVLGRWFDRHLKGLDVDTGPAIQVEDSIGFWRNADSFPPAAPTWERLHLTADSLLAPEGGATSTVALDPPRGGPAQVLEFKGAVLGEDLRISGMPQLTVAFKTNGQGGMLGAWLFDEDNATQARAPFWLAPDKRSPDPTERHWRPAGIPVIGHAQMNLRYYAGGEEAQTLTPGEQYIARMEFEPMEALVPKGHRLVLWLFQYAYPDHANSATPAPIEVTLGGEDTVLRLSTLDVDPKTVFPVPGVHFPEREHASRKHVAYPGFPGGLAGTGLAVAAPSASVPMDGVPLVSAPCAGCPP